VAVSAAAVTVLLSVTVVPAVASGVAAALSPVPTGSTTVVVEPGQSLWQIAQTVAPSGDTASMVARIADANGITRADQLRPGQRLQVPLS
jgi:nucleoid-associated protein YgaU